MFYLITLTDTHTLGRSPLNKGSARQKDPLPNNTQHSQETHAHAPVRVEPAIPASKRSQTYAATGTRHLKVYCRESARMIESLKTQTTRS